MSFEAREAIVRLLKGVFYKEDEEKVWFALLQEEASIKEYLQTIALEVLIDTAEGYAYVKSIEREEEDERSLSKLVSKRELSYKVSLLVVLLRRRLVDFELQSENFKAVVTLEEMAEELQNFLSERFDEVKLQKEIAATIKKVEELGFLKKLGTKESTYEIRPAIKAFVDAQWLGEFDKKLKEYRSKD